MPGDPLGLGDLPPSITMEGTVLTAPSSAEAPTGSVAPEILLENGGISLIDVEQRLLREAIRQSGGNLSQAAKRLGISYKTMRYRARKFGLGD